LLLILWSVPAVRWALAVAAAALIIAALQDFWRLTVALLDQKKPLEEEKVHGRARDATEEEAFRAARRGRGGSALDQRKF
jgi:uncharacterized membrane protein YqjE